MDVLNKYHRRMIEVSQNDITCSVREDGEKCAVANALNKVFGNCFSDVSVGGVFVTFSHITHGEHYIHISYCLKEWIRAYDMSTGLVSPINIKLMRRYHKYSDKPQYYFEIVEEGATWLSYLSDLLARKLK